MPVHCLFVDRGVEYVFSLRARNSVDYGEQAVQSITTPEGSESRTLIGQPRPRLHFIGWTTTN